MILIIPLQPLWTFIALVVVCSMWVLGLLMVESAGHPELDSITGFVYYKKGLKYISTSLQDFNCIDYDIYNSSTCLA